MTTGLTDIDQVKNARAQDRSWDALAKTSGDDFAVLTMLFLDARGELYAGDVRELSAKVSALKTPDKIREMYAEYAENSGSELSEAARENPLAAERLEAHIDAGVDGILADIRKARTHSPIGQVHEIINQRAAHAAAGGEFFKPKRTAENTATFLAWTKAAYPLPLEVEQPESTANIVELDSRRKPDTSFAPAQPGQQQQSVPPSQALG